MIPQDSVAGVGRNQRWFAVGVSLLLSALSCSLQADEPYLHLKINEVIANNNTVGPVNWNCKHVDMIELYNPTDEDINLSFPGSKIKITDGNSIYEFGGVTSKVISRQGRFVLFCDAQAFDDDRDCLACSLTEEQTSWEAHANFKLDNDGETITLLGPDFEVIDEVTYPPLPADVSYARFPDGADSWVFCPKTVEADLTSFGDCARPPTTNVACEGASNLDGANLPPRISLDDYSTNTPGPDQPVWIGARVEDEILPDEEDIERVEIVYRLDGGDEETVAMDLLEIRTNVDNPLDRWSLWGGEIPGQAEGTIVDFHLHVVDRNGGERTEPARLCDYPGGPCRPIKVNCQPTACSACTCAETLPPGCENECQVPYRYVVGLPGGSPLVINEVVAENQHILEDTTEKTTYCNGPEDIPIQANFCHFDDFLELYNGSDVTMDLAGLVLSAKPFHPGDGWVFPAGSSIPARGYLIVWVDGDGEVRCDVDPNDPAADPPELHTDFNVDGRSDEIILFEPFHKAGGSGETFYRVLDGLRWGRKGEPIDEHGAFISMGESWEMYKGIDEPPLQGDAQVRYPWTDLAYPESGWIDRKAPMGYGLDDLSSELDDMPSGYLTVYFRRKVTVPDSLYQVLGQTPGPKPTDVLRLLVKRLFLDIRHDDGFRAYLNGELVATRNLPVPETDSVLEITGGITTRYVRLTRTHDLPALEEIDPGREVLDITGSRDLLLKGPNANVLAIEVHNASLESPDFLFDARLFWGVEGLGNDESLSRIPDGSREGIVLNVSKFCETLECKKEYATPRAANRAPLLFRRGDAAWPPDGQVNMGDVVAILWALFSPPPESFCWEAADADNSGGVDLSDVIDLLVYLFQGGAPTAPPGPLECGPDVGTPIPDCDYPLTACF